MSDPERRNPYQELVSIIPNTSDLPLQSVLFHTLDDVSFKIIRESHTNDYRNPNSVRVEITTPSARDGGVLAANIRVCENGEMEGFIGEKGLVPGIPDSSITLAMSPEQKAQSIDSAVVLVDFLQAKIQQ